MSDATKILDKWAASCGVRFVCRSYGQYTTDTISRDNLHDLVAEVRAAALEEASKTRAGAPRTLPRMGTGGLHGEQQYCFAMGWKEGAAAVRKNIHALKDKP